jgi:hypothetical protein
MKLVKIKDSDYVRDMQSNAVLNVNKQELDEFNTKRHKILEEKKDKEETKIRLSKLESDLGEIKQLLKDIVDIRSGNAN